MMRHWLLPAAVGLTLCTAHVSAEDKGKAKAAHAVKAAPQPKAAGKARRSKANKKAEEPLKPAHGETRAADAAHAPPPPPLAAEDEGDVHKEGGTEVKTLEFTGLDIEGQLKTPQMLYFLNRLRAEFSRPELPHRSFIPELSRSSKEKDL